MKKYKGILTKHHKYKKFSKKVNIMKLFQQQYKILNNMWFTILNLIATHSCLIFTFALYHYAFLLNKC